MGDESQKLGKTKRKRAKNRWFLALSGGVGGIRTHGTRRYNWFRVSPVMTTSIPLRVFIFTSALKNTSEKGENWWRELRDIHFSMIAENPRKIKVFQRWASKKVIRFRVSPVMTTSISLRIRLCLNFARLLQGRWWNAVIQNSRKMKHLRGNRRKQELLQVAEWWARLPFESAPLWPLRYVSVYVNSRSRGQRNIQFSRGPVSPEVSSRYHLVNKMILLPCIWFLYAGI